MAESNWLVDRGFLVEASVRGFGQMRPKAPSLTPDGSDDPRGRRKSRWVEITIDE